MLRNIALSLFRYELIKTTLPKAKEIRRIVEPLITLAKEDNVANRRLAFASLRNDVIVAKLFKEIAPRHKEHSGGYCRILKYGFRNGDRAPMAIIELVNRKKLEVSKVE